MASHSVGLLLTPGLVLDLNSNITGYYRELPGFGRYAVLGSDKSGVFNLQINNASLSDEAVYECQVGPNGTNKPIRASAKLNVLCEYLSLPSESQSHNVVLQCLQPRQSWSVSSPAPSWW